MKIFNNLYNILHQNIPIKSNNNRFHNLVPLNKDTVNFSLNNSQKEFQLPNNEEFEKLKNEIQSKLNKPKYKQYFEQLSSVNITKENILVFKKILDEKNLYKNPFLMKYSVNMLSFIETPEQCMIANKLLDHKNCYKNNRAVEDTLSVIWDTTTPERYTVSNKILSEEKLYNEPEVLKSIKFITSSIETQEDAKLKLDIINRILSDENLYNNPDFMQSAADLITDIKTKEELQFKFGLIDKILINKKTSDNPNLIKDSIELILKCISNEQIQAAEKILSTPYLFNSKNFMQNADKIIKEIYTQADVQRQINLIDKILSDENSSLTPEQIMICLNNKDENFYKNIQILNKKIGIDAAVKLTNTETITAAKFILIHNKQNINNLSIKEKKALLRELVASNSDLFMTSDYIKQFFPLLPNIQEEYCSMLNSLTRSIGIETNSLTTAQIEDFNISLNNLSNSLTGITDEEFNNLNIKQKYSKDEFILDTLKKIENLTDSECQKVYDYFGFELQKNERSKTGFSIIGYPVNLNNGEKLSKIENPETAKVIEALRKDVIRFSENNPIYCNNPEIEKYLNEVISSLP